MTFCMPFGTWCLMTITEDEESFYDLDTPELDDMGPKDLALLVLTMIDHEMPVPTDFLARLHQAGIFIDN